MFFINGLTKDFSYIDADMSSWTDQMENLVKKTTANLTVGNEI